MDPAAAPAIAEPSAAPVSPPETTDTLTEATARVRQALEDVLTTVRSFKDGATGYFNDQLDRGTAVLEQVRDSCNQRSFLLRWDLQWVSGSRLLEISR